MRFLAAVALLVGIASLSPGEGRAFVAKALEFEVVVPEGWRVTRDRTGIVAQEATSEQGTGFQITREPFFQADKTFPAAWQAQLDAEGLEAKVIREKTGKYEAWHAAWTSGGEQARAIEVWRLHTPENEMLYNLAFSAPEGADLTTLVRGVVGSFRCTAPKAKLEFASKTESIGIRAEINLPAGLQPLPRDVQLGGGGGPTFVKLIPGYKQTHIAVLIRLQTQPAGAGGARLPDGSVVRGGVKEIAAGYARALYGRFKDPRSKPRARSARYGGFRGYAAKLAGVDKQGLPKRAYVFAGKRRQTVLVAAIVVDEREIRLHKDYFRQLCSKIKVRS